MSIFSWFCRKEINELNERLAWMRRELERVAAERDEAEAKYKEATTWLRIDDYPQIKGFFDICAEYETDLKRAQNRELTVDYIKGFLHLREWFKKYRFPYVGNILDAIGEKDKENRQLNDALDESLARRDELSREIENLTAQNNSLKEKVNFLGDTTRRRNETAGRLLEERTELETKICVLKNENDSLRKEKRDVVFEKFRLKRKAERREHMLEKMCKIHGEFFVHVYFLIFRNDPDDCYYKMSAVLNHFGTTKKTFFQHFGNIFELATVNGVKTNVISKKTLFAFLKDNKQKIVEFISKQAMLSREIEIKESEAAQ